MGEGIAELFAATANQGFCIVRLIDFATLREIAAVEENNTMKHCHIVTQTQKGGQGRGAMF